MKTTLPNIISLLFGLAFVVNIWGCKGKVKESEPIDLVQKQITFEGLKRISVAKQDPLYLLIDSYYRNDEKCSDSVVNSNIYACTNAVNGDTIFVFDVCRKVPDYVDEKPDEGFVIFSDDVENTSPKSVNVIVPRSFKISKGSRFIFGELSRFID
ncbi:MAG: hypothetical protein EOP04_14045 [Proteobacteria bacterium]|nr:MAG: hypothetical protein EOP04_14045 [Pseudomonadota bacterium]